MALRYDALILVELGRAERTRHLAVPTPETPFLVVDHDTIGPFVVRA
jgi:hypothetical protein